MDAPWDDPWDQPRRPGWLARVAAAFGRLFSRRRGGVIVIDPADEDAGDGAAAQDRTVGGDGIDIDVGEAQPRPRGRGRRHAPVERTRPITAGDLIETDGEAPRRSAVHHAPPPPPTRATTSPGIRLATAVAELAPGEFDALDATITSLLMADELEPPPAPTAEQEAWLELLGPLIEYELLSGGGAAMTFQSTAAQLGELVALTDVDFNAAVRLVSRDPAIAAAILSAANSAEHQRGTPLSDIRGAVARLGLTDTRRLAIAIATRALYDPDTRVAAPHHRARAHRDLHRTMTCAFASAALAGRSQVVGGEDAFVTGMFLDVGRPLVHRAVMTLERRRRVELVPDAALEMVIERTHAGVGGDALAAWGLPLRLGELARHHLAAVPPVGFDGADLQRLALVSTLVLLRTGAPVPLAAARRAADALGLGRAELRALALDIVEMADKVTALFGVRDGDTTWGAPSFA